MAKLIYKEKQKLHQPGLVGLLLIFTFLVVYKFVNDVMSGIIGESLMVTLLFIASLGFAWFAYYQAWMRIKFNTKNIKVRVGGLFSRYIKLPVNNVASIEFVHISPAEKWNGALAHPAGDFHLVDFGDSGGVCITMKNGEKYMIASDNAYAHRDTILEQYRHTNIQIN